jgi:PAS domain S-box-containing protein
MGEPDKLNILLVDDQPAKLLSYEVILSDLGENLLKAQSGGEALGHLLKNEVAVVLVDVCMPGLDGFELASLIRDHPRCQRTAIIFISAIHLGEVDRLRGYEMGAVDYVPVPVVPQVLRAKVKVFAELFRKTRQLEQMNQLLEQRVAERTAELESSASRLTESERRRSLALAAGKMGSWDWDLLNGDCMWDEGQCRIFGVDPKTFKVTPERLRALLEPKDWDLLMQALKEATPSARTYETEFRVRRSNGEVRWCLGAAAATVDSQGRIARISGVTMDITDRKQGEERQVFLAREVDHRARNVLAVVQSMLRLTKAETTKDFVAAVEGRINALSRAHMLLSEGRWEGADLSRLINEELDPYRGEADRLVAMGPELLLEPRRAQSIALAVHELATNAAKHGALAHPSGNIKLSWRLEPGNLILNWCETGGTPAKAPSSRGYGMRVISASIEQLGGAVEFKWQQAGLHCILSLPLSEKTKRLDGTRRRPIGANGPTRSIASMKGNNRILLVEDDPLVAMMMAEILSELGFTVIGPYGNTAEATKAISEAPLCAAILDINLGNELVYPVADLLASRETPFAFVTGYGAESVNPHYPNVPVLLKPVDRDALGDLFAHWTNGSTLAATPGHAQNSQEAAK